MSLIRPFRALRPLPEVAERVAAVPYDVVNTEEARSLAADNPLSFLHVSRPEIDLPASTDPYSDEVYARALENLTRLRAEAPLIVEEEPSLYLYRLRMGDHEQTGLAACFSLDEYDRGSIKKHERTRRDKEDDRMRHMKALRAQTGPVFLTYRASASIDGEVERLSAPMPLFDFEAPDGIRHTLWRVTGPDAAVLQEAFRGIDCLYIADGHHRAASAARTRAALAGEAGWMLAVAFPDNQTRILPYNRALRDLAGHTPEGFLQSLQSCMQVTNGAPVPARSGEVSMYLGGRWYTLHLKAASLADQIGSSLDVSLLQDQVLGALLQVHDPRTDKRLEFIGGIRGADELQRLVDTGRAAVAFSLLPVSVKTLMRIADAGEIMPPKSTWFEPKLRDGLLSHLI